MSRRLTPLGWIPLVALILVSAAPAHALTVAGEELYLLADDETRTGDHYIGAKKVSLLGTLEGDLVATGQTIEVHGTVTGDLVAAGSILSVSGHIGDSTRLAGSQVSVSGTIEGDLVIFASVISISPGTRVSGDVVVFGGEITVDGDVAGTVRANGAEVLFNGSAGGDFLGTAGQISLLGTVARNVKLTADTLKIGPSTRVEGDLEYTAREPVEDLEGMDVVAGTVEYHKKKKKEPEEETGGLSWSWFFRRILLFLAALLTGFVLLRLFPTQAARAVATMGKDPLPSFGVGFVLTIVLPVAVGIVCFFVVTIPLAFITLLLYVIGIYLAKYPVALWIGRRALQLMGVAEPSPYLSLTVGLVPLVVVFQVPFFLGWLAWFVTIFLGMGSIFLAIQSRGGAPVVPGAAPVAAAGGDPA
jgi:cytoskeletal protein CcmA (bactofilin family)